MRFPLIRVQTRKGLAQQYRTDRLNMMLHYAVGLAVGAVIVMLVMSTERAGGKANS